MQQKYLRLAAGSLKIHRVFLWADLGLRQKGGGKKREKRKFKKDYCGKKKTSKLREKKIKNKNKKEKKKEQKRQISKRSLILFVQKRKKLKKTKKGIIHTELVQERHKPLARSKKKCAIRSVNISLCGLWELALSLFVLFVIALFLHYL